MRSSNGLAILFLLLLSLCCRYAAARSVFAHYMLWAPSASDDVAGFKKEIQYAQSVGIDAFALNTNAWNADTYRRRADQLYQAATELGTGFKLFFSLDMHKDSSFLSADNVQEMITRYSSNSSQYMMNNKQFVTSWLGNDPSVFAGFSNALDGWTKGVFDRIGGKDKYFFVPFFPTGGSQEEVSSLLKQFGSLVDGLFAWDTSAWPYKSNDFNNPSDSADRAYLAACNAAGKSFMASVSPWFFKHVDCCSAACKNPNPPNQVDCGCQVKGNYQGPGLWLTRWQQIISNPPPLVQIVTWNDWVERTYVAPILNPAWGPQDSNDESFPHKAFLELGAHYIQWYKSGKEPSISSDSIFIFYYSMSKSAQASSDPCRPQNSGTLDDRLYVVSKLASPATLQITSGSSTKSFNVAAGVRTSSVPLLQGQQSAKLLRNGAQLLSVVGDKLVSNTVSMFDYNVYSNYNP